MKKEFLLKFALISLVAMALLVVVTQFLGFEPNVSSTISRYFFYAIAFKFIFKLTEEDEEEFGVYLYLIKLAAITVVMAMAASIVTATIGYIFSLDLNTTGMAAHTALVVGFMLGYKFVKFFEKKLFKEDIEEVQLADIDEADDQQ